MKPSESSNPASRHLWRSIEERGAAPVDIAREFPMGAATLSDGVGRRDFLQLLGSSLALAGLNACFSSPVEKILPYTHTPAGLVPGNPLHFATTLTLGGFGTGVVVTSHEGRPTKIEGNALHPASRGAAGVFEQATLLQLYDPQRASAVRHETQPQTWLTFLKQMRAHAAKLEASQGQGLRFLMDPCTSPLVEVLRAQLLQRFPKARIFTHASATRANVYAGAQLALGQSLESLHRLDRAMTVVALDSDFLGAGPWQLRCARDFASRRDPGPGMNRLYVAEPALTVTGMAADHRLRVRPSEISALAVALAAQVGVPEAAGLAGQLSPEQHRWVAAVGNDLLHRRGAALVMVGDRQPAEVHAIVHALNAALDAAGNTLNYFPRSTLDASDGPGGLAELAKELHSGAVDTLVATAWNPAYVAPSDIDFQAALEAVPNVVYWSPYEDETAAHATWFLPAAHPLESWGDARALDGTASIVQPLIAPLFNGVTEVEVLAAFVDQADRGTYALLKDSWRSRTPRPDFDTAWEQWLADGVIPNTAFSAQKAVLQPTALRAAAEALAKRAAATGSPLEVAFAADTKVYDGRFANNAWLQELPEPVTKMAWDNAALMSPHTAEALALHQGDVVTLGYRGGTVEAPVAIAPGAADGCVTVTLGYGREGGEAVARGVGFNAYRLRSSDSSGFGSGLSVQRTLKTHKLAITQEHWGMEGRALALATTVAQWHAHPDMVSELRGPQPTLHEPVVYEGHKWAMAVDLSRCTGCSACIVACQSENNIPVVGRQNVLKSREMHWLRLDRYFEGPVENPSVVVQPVACVHCESAPCEYVCPVNATVHSDEGLNEMVYNRCVGTRYCSNNCPYKVRRFNYLHWEADPTATQKMVKNPEVTVRERGVMEKCSYCVQRIEHARIASRISGKPLRDGEIKTACQQACPTTAIAFGDLSDPQSRVSKLHRDDRRYDLLHELGTRPRTAYLLRVRNTNPELG